VEGTTQCHDQLAQPFVGMAATTLAARHVVDPVGALDVEGHVLQLLGHGKIAARVAYFTQVNDAAFVNS